MNPAHVLILVLAVIPEAAPVPRVFAQEFDVLARQATSVACPNIDSDFKARYRALRQIDDPGTHQSWLLIRDLYRASGPAFFVKLLHSPACPSSVSGKMNFETGLQARMLRLPVIHAGDPVILSEHTNISDAELEATALEAAAGGDALRVRLRFGGFTVRAIATAPGRAALVSEAGKRRP